DRRRGPVAAAGGAGGGAGQAARRLEGARAPLHPRRARQVREARLHEQPGRGHGLKRRPRISARRRGLARPGSRAAGTGAWPEAPTGAWSEGWPVGAWPEGWPEGWAQGWPAGPWSEGP